MPKIEFDGLEINYNHPHDVSGIVEVLVLNVYGSENIRKGDTVVDIGAGIGDFALLASRRVGTNGRVIAIEPSPEDYATLLLNLKENSIDNTVPLNLAVSDKSETLKVQFKGKAFDSRAYPMDKILHDLHINSDAVRFIKMDIEGGESKVIPSSAEIIKRIDFLAMEIHWGYHNSLIPLMSSLGFAFSRVTRKKYLISGLKTAISHPFATYSIYRTFKETGEFSGFGKIASSFGTPQSDDLVIGTFRRQGTDRII